MASKVNSEFNYRYQIKGDTPWEKIKQLQNFLEGRVRAGEMEKISEMQYQAKLLDLEHAKQTGASPGDILRLEADILEIQASFPTQQHAFELNKQEIEIIKKLIDELYEIVEPTRMKHPDGTPYTDEEMFEANAANEFTMMIAREMQAEIIVGGRPSPAKLKNAMSNPYTFNALKEIGFIPKETVMLEGSADPLNIEIRPAALTSSVDAKQDKLESST